MPLSKGAPWAHARMHIETMHLSRIHLSLLLVSALLSAAPAPAPIDVAEIVRQAIETNPERQAYLAAIDAEREAATGADANQDPVLSLELGRKRQRAAGGAFEGEGQVWVASLSQTFEWPERQRLRRALAETQVELAQLGLSRFEQALEARVTALAYRLSRAQLRTDAAAEVAARLAALRRAIAERDPSGPAPVVELHAVEAAEWLARQRAEDARLALQQVTAELNQLRGAPLSAALLVKTPTLSLAASPSPERLAEAARRGNFAYRERLLESEQLGLQSDLARSDSVPGFTAGPYVSQDGVAGNETIIGLRLDLPLPVGARSSVAERTAAQRRRQARVAADAAWRELERELAQTALTYDARVAQIRTQTDDPAVHFARAARQAETHFRAGAISLQLFMDAQTGYIEAVDAALLLQEQAAEAGFKLRELSGAAFTPLAPSR